MNKLKILLSIVLLSSYGNAFAMQGAASSSMKNAESSSTMEKNAESMRGYWSLSELKELFKTVTDDRLRISAALNALKRKTQELKKQHVDTTKSETLSITSDEIDIISVIYEKYQSLEGHQLYTKVYQSAFNLLAFLLSKKDLLSTEAAKCLEELYGDQEKEHENSETID